jgi:hypothetical protein
MPTYTTYGGTGAVVSADYKAVKWVGKTKGGKAVEINLTNAINRENINLAFAEKDDTINTLTFEACYSNTDAAASSTTEPWTVVVEQSPTSGAAEILLGAGLFYIGGTAVALTRGGGTFTVEREYREINADGDRGAVKDRVVMESSRAKLTINALTWLTKMADMWPGFTVTS